MHMADALVSPAVGGALWAVAAGATAWSARRVAAGTDERRAPLMGVLGAFVFSVQMINFAIPGTGSSGHLGGALLLSILLGPHAAFLAMVSVLAVQALFFADGGLLALGCNIVNLGVFPCFLAYPLVFRPVAGAQPAPRRLLLASLMAAVAAFQLGALAVVLETVASGISALPFSGFLLLMQPIHLVIGLVEGFVTFAVVRALWQARPELLPEAPRATSMRAVVAGLAVLTVGIGGILSLFASAQPDGLEWSVAKISGVDELASPADSISASAERLQDRMAPLPDYTFPAAAASAGNIGKSAAGITGAGCTLTIIALLGLALRRFGAAPSAPPAR